MEDRTLFDMGDAHRLARASDPATSKEAAREIMSQLPFQQAWALGIVDMYGPSTSSEISTRAGQGTNHRLSRRLPELERKGLIVRESARRCRVTGKKAAVWRVKE